MCGGQRIHTEKCLYHLNFLELKTALKYKVYKKKEEKHKERHRRYRGEREREAEETGVRHNITEQCKAIILRWAEINKMAPCGHLQSHSHPRPGKGGPAGGR